MHMHACHRCGAIWSHDAPGEHSSRKEFIRLHTCPNGHLCTVQYSAMVAHGIQGLVNAGRDPIPYLKETDPEAHYLLTESNR